MKQKKIGTTLYVFSEDPYVITEDTDANIIYIQEEVINRFARINLSLISKMKPINYHVTCVKHPEWADYYNGIVDTFRPEQNSNTADALDAILYEMVNMHAWHLNNNLNGE